MATTSRPGGPETPAGPPLNDERALERVFRAQYATLAEEAKTHLGDAASAAPRIVEATFARAWDERARFKTAQELDAFLHAEVAHASARALSRRASAHRFGGKDAHGSGHGSDAPVDVDQSWARVSSALQPVKTADPGAAAEHSRHDAAAHMAGLAKKRSLTVPIVIGCVLVGVVAGGIFWLNRMGHESGVVAALSAQDARPHSSLAGQLGIVDLDDGTKIKLAPESKVIVPKDFGDAMRVVKLEGAAFFAVASGRATPFEIRTGNVVADATGTQIVVRNYPSDSAVTVFVKQGQAIVHVGKTDQALAEGKAVRVLANGQLREPTAGELAEATTWADDKLTVSNRPLREVLPEMRRWYRLDIKVPDAPLLDRTVTIEAPLDSSLAAIAGIEKSAHVKFGYAGETMVFKDAANPAKKK